MMTNKGTLRWNQSKKVAATLFMLPTLLFITVFSLVPMLYSLWMSFQSYNTSMSKDTIHFIGLRNYASVLSNAQFLSSALWTFVFTICVVLLNVILGLTLAMLLTYAPFEKLTKIFKTVFTLPMMIAPIVIATIWKLIFSPIYGLLNGLLFSVGMERVEWLSAELPARIALITVEVWATTPLCMLILIAALKTVPVELMEASTADGATSVQKFLHITLPSIKNHIALIVIIRFMDAIRMFDIVYNLTNGGPGTSTETLASTIYKMAFRYFNVGEGAAAAYIFFLLIVFFSFISMKLLGKKEEA